MLIHAGDWDTLPTDIKYNIQLYAFLYEKTYPRMMEEEKAALEKRISDLEAEKQAFVLELEIMNKRGGKVEC